MIEDKGQVYLASNPSMPNLFKIGLSRVGMDIRLKTLNSTSSIALPFEIESVITSDHCGQLEKFLHRCLSRRRVSKSREFFSFECVNEAIDAFETHSEAFTPKAYTTRQARKVTQAALIPSTPSQQAKAYGLKTLSEVSRRADYPVSTLRDMYKYHPLRFKCVCLGSLALRELDCH